MKLEQEEGMGTAQLRKLEDAGRVSMNSQCWPSDACSPWGCCLPPAWGLGRASSGSGAHYGLSWFRFHPTSLLRPPAEVQEEFLPALTADPEGLRTAPLPPPGPQMTRGRRAYSSPPPACPPEPASSLPARPCSTPRDWPSGVESAQPSRLVSMIQC